MMPYQIATACTFFLDLQRDRPTRLPHPPACGEKFCSRSTPCGEKFCSRPPNGLPSNGTSRRWRRTKSAYPSAVEPKREGVRKGGEYLEIRLIDKNLCEKSLNTTSMLISSCGILDNQPSFMNRLFSFVHHHNYNTVLLKIRSSSSTTTAAANRDPRRPQTNVFETITWITIYSPMANHNRIWTLNGTIEHRGPRCFLILDSVYFCPSIDAVNGSRLMSLRTTFPTTIPRRDHLSVSSSGRPLGA